MDNLTINCLQKEKGKKNLKEARRCLELLLLLKETTGSHSGVFDFVNRGFREKVNGPSGTNCRNNAGGPGTRGRLSQEHNAGRQLVTMPHSWEYWTRGWGSLGWQLATATTLALHRGPTASLHATKVTKLDCTSQLNNA